MNSGSSTQLKLAFYLVLFVTVFPPTTARYTPRDDAIANLRFPGASSVQSPAVISSSSALPSTAPSAPAAPTPQSQVMSVSNSHPDAHEASMNSSSTLQMPNTTGPISVQASTASSSPAASIAQPLIVTVSSSHLSVHETFLASSSTLPMPTSSAPSAIHTSAKVKTNTTTVPAKIDADLSTESAPFADSAATSLQEDSTTGDSSSLPAHSKPTSTVATATPAPDTLTILVTSIPGMSRSPEQKVAIATHKTHDQSAANILTVVVTSTLDSAASDSAAVSSDTLSSSTKHAQSKTTAATYKQAKATHATKASEAAAAETTGADDGDGDAQEAQASASATGTASDDGDGDSDSSDNDSTNNKVAKVKVTPSSTEDAASASASASASDADYDSHRAATASAVSSGRISVPRSDTTVCTRDISKAGTHRLPREKLQAASKATEDHSVTPVSESGGGGENTTVAVNEKASWLIRRGKGEADTNEHRQLGRRGFLDWINSVGDWFRHPHLRRSMIQLDRGNSAHQGEGNHTVSSDDKDVWSIYRGEDDSDIKPQLLGSETNGTGHHINGSDFRDHFIPGHRNGTHEHGNHTGHLSNQTSTDGSQYTGKAAIGNESHSSKTRQRAEVHRRNFLIDAWQAVDELKDILRRSAGRDVPPEADGGSGPNSGESNRTVFANGTHGLDHDMPSHHNDTDKHGNHTEHFSNANDTDRSQYASKAHNGCSPPPASTANSASPTAINGDKRYCQYGNNGASTSAARSNLTPRVFRIPTILMQFMVGSNAAQHHDHHHRRSIFTHDHGLSNVPATLAARNLPASPDSRALARRLALTQPTQPDQPSNSKGLKTNYTTILTNSASSSNSRVPRILMLPAALFELTKAQGPRVAQYSAVPILGSRNAGLNDTEVDVQNKKGGGGGGGHESSGGAHGSSAGEGSTAKGGGAPGAAGGLNGGELKWAWKCVGFEYVSDVGGGAAYDGVF